ncbi:hypothetical protein FQN52_006462 [Onygenales sp. PD_12]|nr:hypothetical protein FQN52_006462 [Onygenales sp. PD_12]
MNSTPSEPTPSPWLISFEGAEAAEKLRTPSVRVQIEHDRRRLGLNRRSANLSNSTTVSSSQGSSSSSSRTDIDMSAFFALATRAYQETVAFPDEPPPAVWAPGDRLHSYYDHILSAFGTNFRELLLVRGKLNDEAFYVEWVKHSRSILENIRAEWGLHPFNSALSIKTSANTANRGTAIAALQKTVERPSGPPPEGWKTGDPLHPYYQSMLERFEKNLEILNERFYNFPLFDSEYETAIAQFETLIIRTNRDTWIEMFGL